MRTSERLVLHRDTVTGVVLISRNDEGVDCRWGLRVTVLTSCTIGPCGISPGWSPNISAQFDLPPRTQYAPAETVYRYFLPDDQASGSATNLAYCLLFGKSDLPLSSSFLSLLSYKHVQITRGCWGIDVQNGVPKDKASGREMVFLKLHSLTIRGDHGTAMLISITPSKAITRKLKLEKQGDQWNVVSVIQNSGIHSRPLLPTAVLPCGVNDGDNSYQIFFYAVNDSIRKSRGKNPTNVSLWVSDSVNQWIRS